MHESSHDDCGCCADVHFGALLNQTSRLIRRALDARINAELIPKQAELLVDGFLFLLAAVGGSYPFVVFDDTDMQGRVVGMGDDFDDPQDGKGVYESEGFSDRPAENAAPVAVAEHAFASFAQVVFMLPVAV